MNKRNIGAKHLRKPGILSRGKSTFIFAVALGLSSLASAQPASQQTDTAETRKDYYRAEFVILERTVDPASINEQMASRIPEPPNPETREILRAVDANGTVETTRDLVPRSELHLNTAANRLENSGKYRVLLATGWYQSFPPDFEGEPLRVAIGDWLPDAGHRDVEGLITVDRQRYLHVNVQLNHWQPMPRTEEAVALMSNTPDESSPSDAAKNTDLDAENVSETTPQPEQTAISGANWPRAELLTWIRETRRMRSEEVHFLDSPTIGVLVFFKKIDE